MDKANVFMDQANVFMDKANFFMERTYFSDLQYVLLFLSVFLGA